MEDKRYVVSLQDTVDPQCYKDFFEFEKLEESKQKADEESEKHQRNALVFDRKLGVVYKKIIERPCDKKEKPIIPRRGRKKVQEKQEEVKEQQPKKIVRKQAFFE